MKIRDGFVTNSSSTSYCIVGVQDKDRVTEIMDAIERIGPTLSTLPKKSWYDIEDYAHALGLEIARDEYDNEMVGFDAERMLQDKSIVQATNQLVTLIKDILGINVVARDVSFLYGGYYNG